MRSMGLGNAGGCISKAPSNRSTLGSSMHREMPSSSCNNTQGCDCACASESKPPGAKGVLLARPNVKAARLSTTRSLFPLPAVVSSMMHHIHNQSLDVQTWEDWDFLEPNMFTSELVSTDTNRALGVSAWRHQHGQTCRCEAQSCAINS
jgi:hypothetical protein